MTTIDIETKKTTGNTEPKQPALAPCQRKKLSIGDVQPLKQEDKNTEQLASRNLLLAELSRAILVYLACVVRHGEELSSPTVHEITEVGIRKVDRNEMRDQLDEVFRNLSSWKKTLLDDRLKFIAAGSTKTKSAVDLVMSALLTIAHQLTHMPSFIESWLTPRDYVFDTVSKSLESRIEKSQNEKSSRLNEECPICNNEETEHEDYLELDSSTASAAYLKRLKAQVFDLKRDSKPLQVVLDRLERNDQQKTAEDLESSSAAQNENDTRRTSKRTRVEDTSTSTPRGSSDTFNLMSPRNTRSRQSWSANLHAKSEDENAKSDDNVRKAKRRMTEVDNKV
ncbi:hypothetical protein NPX13_g1493 [Xylaria arbuscula]|uniref:Uncharacterized protein n=1 Tax=Xylaria arbuscula TaxID=114810 RepID=A0A9W8NLI9_9PEZI|nr:hypothetical protein NPX13_g1493 [Xylaria arbuscula]